MEQVGLVVLGAVLAVFAGVVQDEIKTRRRLRNATRVLIHEIWRLQEYYNKKGLEDEDVRDRLESAVSDYKAALFEVNTRSFEDHYPVYKELVASFEVGNEFKTTLRLVAKIASKLTSLVEEGR